MHLLIDISHFAFIYILSGNYINTFITFKNEEEVKCLTCSCTNCVSPEGDHTTGMSNVNWIQQSEEQNVGFTDQQVDANLGWSIAEDPVECDDIQDGATLQQFLSRPVRIAGQSWSISDAPYTKTTIYPWTGVLTNPRVLKKIANFGFIRANLKIRVLTNASPFYYGAMRLCYQPLPTFKVDSIKSTGVQSLIPYSQRLGFMIRPGVNEAYEMTIPFFYQANKYELAGLHSGGNANELGKIDFVIYAPLRSANSVAAAAVTVDTYAWLEDVELTSYTLAPQSAEVDEYGQGVVSAPATALADSMARLTDVPVIGKFATATEIGARAVAKIAHLFGFTNVPVISDAAPFRSEPFPHMAATDIGYPVEKLTVDSKAELSVAPSALGLSNTDELTISHLAQRESFISSATWSTTNVEDDLLFSARVTPMCYQSTGDVANTYVDMTPTGMLACLYKHWRGDLIYRFDVIASPYHKGRLIISHDPSGTSTSNLMNTSGTTNAVNTQIVDISSTTSFEMRIPYQQALSYALTRTGVNSTFLTSSACPWVSNGAVGWTSQGDLNGHITVRVQTILTAPVAVAPVSILVSVRGADNLEFANPSNPPIYLSTAVAQATEVDDAHEPDKETLGHASSTQRTDRVRMHFGEMTASVRPLLRRMCYLGSIAQGTSGSTYTGGDWIGTYRFRRNPPMFGYDANGLSTAVGLVATGSTFPFNFVNPTPLTWLMPCFVAYRGSINWTFDVNANGRMLSNVSVVRDNNTASFSGFSWFNAASGATSSARNYFYARRSRNGVCGTTLTNQNTQTGVNVAIPNLTQYRFQTTDASTALAGTSSDGSNYESCVLEIKEGSAVIPTEVNVHQYVGAGVDFNLHYFLNVPTWVNYGAMPVSA